MAQDIGKRRGKSPIKVRLEKEREASRRDPEGKKSVVSKAAIASLAIPGSLGVKAGAKAAKAAKAAKNAIVDNPVMKAIQKVPNKYPRTTAGTIVGGGGVLKKRKENETRDKKDKKKMKKGGIVKSHRGDGIAKRGRTRGRIV